MVSKYLKYRNYYTGLLQALLVQLKGFLFTRKQERILRT